MREFRSGRDHDSDSGRGGGRGIAAGKQTLSEAGAPEWSGEAASPSVSAAGRALQLMVAEASAAPAGPSAEERGAVAARGVEGASGALPEQEAIQRSFGRHSLQGIGVAIGGAAREAADELGAQAYTFGRRISLGRGSSLRVQAHEATHALQQRAGKVSGHGQEGDAHEQAAEAVADRVERGESAEALLDELVGAPSARGAEGQAGEGAGGEAVQCLSITAAEIPGRWGIPGGHALLNDAHYLALVAAITAYETPPAVAPPVGAAGTASVMLPKISAALEAAKLFRAQFPLAFPVPAPAPAPAVPPPGPPPPTIVHKRINTQLQNLINELYKELQTQLVASSKDGTQRTDAGDRLMTVPERISSAASKVAGGEDRQKEAALLLKYEHRLGFVGQAKDSVGDADGPAILQSWRARGDMYHVGAVMNLFPRLKVIVYDLPKPPAAKDEASYHQSLEHAERWKQAVMISEYYGQADRVFYTHAGDVSARGDKGDAYAFHQGMVANRAVDTQRGLFIDVGGCTTIVGLAMQHARGQGAGAYRDAKEALAAAVAPDPKEGDGRAGRAEILDYYRSKGWDDNTKYVILNYRASGHAQMEKMIKNVPPGPARQEILRRYNPATDQEGGNHPDLDTGVQGIQQLATIVRGKGYTPIFMGEEPANQAQPHLIKYWEAKHTFALPGADGELGPPTERKLCRGGRASEAFMLRVLAEQYDVRLLAMRSGITDQLAFLNIPTISIDVDNFHQAAVPQLMDVPAYEKPSDAVAHSWARGGKLEAGLGRDYGRVFLEDNRELKSVTPDGKWKGKFSDHDVASITDAVDLYFGEAADGPDENAGVRHKSHPLHPDKLKATSDRGAGVDQQLRAALPGKIDTNLNPDVVLLHARTVLQGEEPKVAEAKKFLDSHLAYTRVDQRAVTPADAEFKAKKLTDQLAFLRDAVEVMRDSGQHGAYAVEKAAIEKGLLDNQRRMAALVGPVRGILPLRAKLEHLLFTFFDKNDGATASARAALANVPLVAPVEQALADARAVMGCEHAAQFHGRLTAIIALALDLFRKMAALVTGMSKSQKSLYYRRPFVELEPTFSQEPAIVLPD